MFGMLPVLTTQLVCTQSHTAVHLTCEFGTVLLVVVLVVLHMIQFQVLLNQ